ncbi:MAG: hypothetical protein LBQ52_08460 [Helicobacteraceae bacterium]|nr:hypothetical protein [Helicobacteraceae bacterium]
MEVESEQGGVIKRFKISWTAYFWECVAFAIKLAILYGAYYGLTYLLSKLNGLLNKATSEDLKLDKVGAIVKFLRDNMELFNDIAFWAPIGLASIASLFFIYNILYLRSFSLYTDNDGVWKYSGILPWSKGASGVKWRDLDTASYYPSFLSWLLKTYSVRVAHRFTKDSEIVMGSVFNGRQAAMHINELHKKFISNINEADVIKEAR